MAPKYSSSSSAAGALRASLVLVLLLTAVAAAQAGQTVSCENKSDVPMTVNGVVVGAHLKVLGIIVVNGKVVVAFTDKHGKHYEESWNCPDHTSDIVIVYVGGFLKVKVKGLLSAIFSLLGFIKVDL